MCAAVADWIESRRQAQSKIGVKAQLLCAECLGLLGAIDPARLALEPPAPDSLHTDTAHLLVELISSHLVRLLRVAPSLPVLDATTFAIQVRLCGTLGSLIVKFGALVLLWAGRSVLLDPEAIWAFLPTPPEGRVPGRLSLTIRFSPHTEMGRECGDSSCEILVSQVRAKKFAEQFVFY